MAAGESIVEPFHALISKLAVSHNREVASLRNQLRLLQASHVNGLVLPEAPRNQYIERMCNAGMAAKGVHALEAVDASETSLACNVDDPFIPEAQRNACTEPEEEVASKGEDEPDVLDEHRIIDDSLQSSHIWNGVTCSIADSTYKTFDDERDPHEEGSKSAEEQQPHENNDQRTSLVTRLSEISSETPWRKSSTADFLKLQHNWALDAELVHSTHSEVMQMFTKSRSSMGSAAFAAAPHSSESLLVQALGVGGKVSCSGALHPTSKVKVCWDIVALLAIMYDVLEMPARVFEPDIGQYGVVISWFTQLFWNVDILVSFHTAYYAKGEAVLSHRRIARRYLASWFPFDFLVVVVDWIFVLLNVSSSESSGQKDRWGRILRVVKLIRLIRILKSVKILAQLDHGLSDSWAELLQANVSLFRVVCLIVIFCHLIACSWYGVGLVSGPDGWVTAQEYDQEGFWQRYFVSLHWAIVQLGLGESEISSTHLPALVFQIVLGVFNLIVVASLIGNITNSFAVMFEAAAVKAQDQRRLRAFFKQHQISRPLRARSLSYLDYLKQNTRISLIDDINLLNQLSYALRAAIMHEVYMPYLEKHAVLFKLSNRSPQLVRNISSSALVVQPYAAEDVVFEAGNIATRAYVIRCGTLKYSIENDGWSPTTDQLQEWSWIAEMALWIEWMYVGDLRASSESLLFIILIAEFGEAFKGHPQEHKRMRQHALLALEDLKILSVSSLSDVYRSPHMMLRNTGGAWKWGQWYE